MTGDGETAKAPDARAVVDRLPYGVVVVGAEGHVLAQNPAADRLLGEHPERCDELYACTSTDGPCAKGCLAARAALATESLPEIRIDTCKGAGVTAVWVTATPLDEGRSALLHLRPGDAKDRRRRSEAHWLSGPKLSIEALGRTRVAVGEGVLSGRWLHQRPGLVLKYLVANRNRLVHAEEIADALWPGAGLSGLNTVRHFVHTLRQHLEPDRAPGTPSSFVVTVQGSYALDRRHVRIDADVFEQLADDGMDLADTDIAAGLSRLEQALRMYRGDLLGEEAYADWASEERDRLHDLAARCLREAARMRRELGDTEIAITHWERLAELEPYDGDIQRSLLTLLVEQGRRTLASRRYAAYRQRMQRAFEEEPDFTLADLKA